MDKQILFVLGLFSLTLADDGLLTKPWEGPIADHVLGVPPKDTPEVVAARRAIEEAHTQVLAILPELPPEERYIISGQHEPASNPIHFQPQRSQVLDNKGHLPPQVPQVQPQVLQVQPQVLQVQPLPPLIRTFAEDVPRSPLGETPEVHAARQAHLKAREVAFATLPRLLENPFLTRQAPLAAATTTTTTQHPGLIYQNYLSQQIGHQEHLQDTPEVAKAKLEHAAAIAAALG